MLVLYITNYLIQTINENKEIKLKLIDHEKEIERNSETLEIEIGRVKNYSMVIEQSHDGIICHQRPLPIAG